MVAAEEDGPSMRSQNRGSTSPTPDATPDVTVKGGGSPGAANTANGSSPTALGKGNRKKKVAVAE